MTSSKVHEINKLSFKDIDIYVGLDVHKKSWKVTIRLGGRALKTFSMDPSAKTLYDYLDKHYPGANYHSVYEAGCFGFYIHRELVKLGINNIIVNAADIPTSDKDRRQKNDTRDSKKMALELENGTGLTAIYIPTEEEEYYRAIFRRREQLKKDRTRTMLRIRSYFTLLGIELPDQAWSKANLELLKAKVHASPKGIVAASLLDDFDYYNKRIKEISAQIKLQTKLRNKEGQQKILETVPGIAQMTSETLLAELIHPRRFQTDNQLSSFAGMIPGTASTGDKDISRGITPRRCGKLRHVLIEAAWTASKCDPELALCFQKLCLRMKKNDAIIRIAKKLLLRIKHVWMKMEPYQCNINIK